VVHAKRILKLAEILTFVSKYYVAPFPTMENTTFHPQKIPTINQQIAGRNQIGKNVQISFACNT
jgi:hypothetical protein